MGPPPTKKRDVDPCLPDTKMSSTWVPHTAVKAKLEAGSERSLARGGSAGSEPVRGGGGRLPSHGKTSCGPQSFTGGARSIHGCAPRQAASEDVSKPPSARRPQRDTPSLNGGDVVSPNMRQTNTPRQKPPSCMSPCQPRGVGCSPILTRRCFPDSAGHGAALPLFPGLSNRDSRSSITGPAERCGARADSTR